VGIVDELDLLSVDCMESRKEKDAQLHHAPTGSAYTVHSKGSIIGPQYCARIPRW
jgi:hypothetical protein